MSLLSRLRNALSPSRLDEDLAAEREDHIARRTSTLIQQGLNANEAKKQAEASFGNVTRFHEQSRDIRMLGTLENTLQDVRYAWRGMLQNPAFSVTAVLSLGLAIGSLTAIYFVINAAILRPLPVPEPHRLFTLAAPDAQPTMAQTPSERDLFSYPLFQQFKAAAASSARLALFSRTNRVEAHSPDATAPWEKVTRQYVSGEAFEILRVPPAAGRVFSKDDDKGFGQHAEAVLSHHYWTRRFNADPAIVGRNIRIENKTYEVIGVARQGFSGVDPGVFVDVWIPATMFDPAVFDNPAINWSRVMGRLSSHATPAQLQTRLQPLFHDDRVGAAKPNTSDIDIRVHDGAQGYSSFSRSFGRPLWIIFAIALAILLVACANVASLLLARSTKRSPEIAMRISLGATQSRLVRQMLTESLVLSAIASCFGFVIASVATPTLVTLISRRNDPLQLMLNMDSRVLLFYFGTCMLATLLFSWLPAMRAARESQMPSLRRQHPKENRLKLGRYFVSIQVAFAFCLVVVGAGFLLTLHNLLTLETGFDPDGVSVLSVSSDDVTQLGVLTLPQAEQLRARVTALTGVKSVAVASWAIFEGSQRTDTVTVPGSPPSERAEIFYRISPGYFATLKIPLLQGRDLSATDSNGGPLVPALVNAAFAKKYFGTQFAIGRQFQRDDGVRHRIVGVAANSFYGDLHNGPEPVVYFPMQPARHFTLYVRSTVNPGSLARLVEREIKATGMAGHVSGTTTLDALVGDTLRTEKLLASIGGTFAFLGVLLAAIGLFGLLNYSVGQRTKELGIRTALGASRKQIAILIAKDLAAMAGGGVAAGIFCSLAIMQVLRPLLFGLSAADPRTVGMALIVLLVAMVAAASLPAIRAISVDPVLSLRHD